MTKKCIFDPKPPPISKKLLVFLKSKDLDNLSINRKPQPGMAFQAKEKFPSIDFTKSIMVGNRMSDMEFGRNAGMHTVYLATTHPEAPFPDTKIDDRYDHLFQFAQAL